MAIIGDRLSQGQEGDQPMKTSLTRKLVLLGLLIATICLGGYHTAYSADPDLPNKPGQVNFGGFVKGPGPDKGAVLTVAEVNPLFKTVRQLGIGGIRFYTSAPLKGSTESQPSLARKAGFTFIASGPWISKDKGANKREIGYQNTELKRGNIDLCIVGSEVMRRGDLKPEELIECIKQMKATAGKVPVTTDDTPDAILANPEVVAELDKIMFNPYPFWSGTNIDDAFAELVATYNKIKAKYPGKEIIIGETGWPSAGKTVGRAVPNPENSLKYMEKVLNWTNANHIRCFYFEAFDEPWKVAQEGPQGAHWGLWTKDSVLKPGVLEIFKQKPISPK